MPMMEMDNEFVEYLFLPPMELGLKAGIHLMAVGRNIAKPNYSVGPKIIEHFGLHVVREGKVEIHRGDKKIVAQAGDIFCIFPHELFHYHIHDQDQPLRMCWFTFQGKFVLELLRHIGMSPLHFHLPGIAGEGVASEIDRFFDKIAAQPTTINEFELLECVFRLFSSLYSETKAEAGPVSIDWYEQAIRFIGMHFRENISVSDVADHVGLSRTYFTQRFTEKSGQTPNRYIQEKRIVAANYLLSISDLKVHEIANTFGYPDPYTFARAYKKRFGVSPSAHSRKTRPASP